MKLTPPDTAPAVFAGDGPSATHRMLLTANGYGSLARQSDKQIGEQNQKQ